MTYAYLEETMTEQETCQLFDHLAGKSGLFDRSYSEVNGHYLYRKLYTERTSPRIDRILFPSKHFKKEGWCYGPIGVEIKSPSKAKHEAARSQCLDYTNAVFEVQPGYWMHLQYVALFPSDEFGGVWAQHRVGACFTTNSLNLNFKWADSLIVNWSISDGVKVRNYGAPGRKVGSR